MLQKLSDKVWSNETKGEKKMIDWTKWNVGILDTKVGNYYLEDVEEYEKRGFKILNAKMIDNMKEDFDVIAVMWTRINEKRIKNLNPKVLVIKDSDEPENVTDVDMLRSMDIPYELIDLWGISTRVAWNIEHIKTYSNGKTVTIIADSPTHVELTKSLQELGYKVFYPLLPKKNQMHEFTQALAESDCVITHLGKDEYPRFWLDNLFAYFKEGTTLISTTRGPLYSARWLKWALDTNHVKTAVLDWIWDKENLLPNEKIIFTNHISYQSDQSRKELTNVVLQSIENAVAKYLVKE